MHGLIAQLLPALVVAQLEKDEHNEEVETYSPRGQILYCHEGEFEFVQQVYAEGDAYLEEEEDDEEPGVWIITASGLEHVGEYLVTEKVSENLFKVYEEVSEWKPLLSEPPENNGDGESEPLLCYHPQSGSFWMMRATFVEDDKCEYYIDGKKVHDHLLDWVLWKYADKPRQAEIEHCLQKLYVFHDVKPLEPPK